MEKLEHISERSEKNEREYLRVNSINEQLIPQVKAWESLKVEHEILQVKYNDLQKELESRSEELETKQQEIKRFSTDLFKCNIKFKNSERDKEELEKKLASRNLESRKLQADLNEVRAKLKDIEEKERDRLETNEDMGTQFSPILTEISTQTDFVGKEVTLRQTNNMLGYPNKMWAKPFVSVGLVNKTVMAERAARTLNMVGASKTTDSLFLPMLSGNMGRSEVGGMRLKSAGAPRRR